MHQRLPTLLPVAALASLAACSSMPGNTSASAAADTDTAIVILPTSGAGEAMRSGCWASF